jgi:hypothetical protein
LRNFLNGLIVYKRGPIDTNLPKKEWIKLRWSAPFSFWA